MYHIFDYVKDEYRNINYSSSKMVITQIDLFLKSSVMLKSMQKMHDQCYRMSTLSLI